MTGRATQASCADLIALFLVPHLFLWVQPLLRVAVLNEIAVQHFGRHPAVARAVTSVATRAGAGDDVAGAARSVPPSRNAVVMARNRRTS